MKSRNDIITPLMRRTFCSTQGLKDLMGATNKNFSRQLMVKNIMVKTTIYTSITGKYDTPRPELTNIIYSKFKKDVLNAKAVKILPHLFLPDTDISVWIDGNLYLKPDFDAVSLLDDADIALFKHRQRDCIYEEAKAAKQRIKNDSEGQDWIDEQITHYRELDFPAHNGLWACYLIIRRNNANMVAFNNAWWAEICRFGYRDQISFPVVLSRHPDVKVKTLINDRNDFNNCYFIRKKHKNDGRN